MIGVKITQIGNSVGFALPKAALERLRVAKGDQLYLVETPEGYLLTPYDPELARQMDVLKALRD